jgi:hypothetical protein
MGSQKKLGGYRRFEQGDESLETGLSKAITTSLPSARMLSHHLRLKSHEHDDKSVYED